MDTSVLAWVGLIGGVAAMAAARLIARSRATGPLDADLSLPGLALALDGGDGHQQLSSANAGRTRVLAALGLDAKADAGQVRAALNQLSLSGGRSGADLLGALERAGKAFSATALTHSGQSLRLEGFLSHNRPLVWALAFDTPAHEQVSLSLGDMLERAPFPVARYDAGLKPQWVNAAYVAAVEGKSADDVIAAGTSLGREVDLLAQRVKAEGMTLEDHHHLSLAGQRRYCRVRISPAGSGVACFVFDETEAEDAREALSRHIEAHDQTLDHVAEGVAIFGRDKRLMFHNKAFAEMWGLDPIWLSDRPTHGAILDHLRERRRLPERPDYARWKADELSHYETLKDIPDELWDRPDGRTIRVFRQPHPMGGLLLLFDDMTGELALKTQYNTLIGVQRATLDQLHEGVAVFTADGRLRLHNAAFAAMWRLQPAALADNPFFDAILDQAILLYANRDDWQGLKARVTDPSPEARVPTVGEWQRLDGTTVQFHTQPLPDGATLVAWVDVTASRKVEQALRDRAAALEEADRLKSDFVAHVSYQLRSPLTTIMGYAELMAVGIGGALNDKQAAQLASIRTGADQLNKLIEDILDLATLEAGALDLEIAPVDVAAAMASAVNLAAMKAEDTRVHIQIDCPDDQPPVMADEKRLKQVLYNLLSNAVRHTPAGGAVTVGARVANGVARIWVADTGAGMDASQQAHAFESFTSGEHGGAGLGLSLVRSFVDLHGGWVDIESTPGAGTTVTCHLPQPAMAEPA
jgi:signal transduction histidine kinase